jgi:hypothetical protein
VRRKWASWRAMGAAVEVLRWLRHGVRLDFQAAPPPPFHHGGATVGVARQSRRLLVNSHLGANDVLIVLSANRVLINRSCVLAIIILICFFLSAGGGGMIHAAAHPSGSFSPEPVGILSSALG